jgi:DNA-binding MarR family transcriptional regulator
MINIYELKLTILQQRILRLLFIKVGTQLNQNQIAKTLNVSQPAVMKSLPNLEKGNIIKVKQDKESRRWAIELNRDNQNMIWQKRADNLKQLYESGLVNHLYNAVPQATIILFGSYAFGEDTTNSDIDLAVIGTKKGIDTKNFDKVLERNININHYHSFRVIDKHLLNNILNGIILKGAIEL